MSSRVAILMCTYNGERFISDQIESFLRQRHDDWELWISDDGSTDQTLELIAGYAAGRNNFHLTRGPGKGFAANFLSLARNSPADVPYYSWSDQDDVWFPDKLARAVAWLGKQDPRRPALYCGRSVLVDADAHGSVVSPASIPRPTFSITLAQCPGGGNTMVFNAAARNLLREGEIPDVFSHDWWLAILVSGCGGAVHADSEPSLYYRQHGENAIGADRAWRARVGRYLNCVKGGFRERHDRNIRELLKRSNLLDPLSLRVLNHFSAAHESGCVFRRIAHLYKSGVRRLSHIENMGLWTAALLGRYP